MKRNPLGPAGATQAAAEEFHLAWRAAFCSLAVLLFIPSEA
jgi:hypothetical protein